MRGKRVFASSVVIVYMVVVNVFSAAALWGYVAATHARTPRRWWSARALETPAPGAGAGAAGAAGALHDTADSAGAADVIAAPGAHCPARVVVVVHVPAGAARALPTLNAMLRSVARADGVLVLVAEVAVFDAALREWCLLATACRLAVLPAWRPEREDARHGVGREREARDDVAAPLHAVLGRALEAAPAVCADGVAVVRAGLGADASFARRLAAVPRERVACLFAGAPTLCSEEALWVPRALLGEALRAPDELALALRGSGGAQRVLRASVELFVARAMQRGLYAGAATVVAAPG